MKRGDAHFFRSFDWLLTWIAVRRGRFTRHLSANTSFNQLPSGFVESTVDLVPSPGDHFLIHRGRIVKVERNRHAQHVQTRDIRIPYETVTLTTFGTSPTFLTSIINEAHDMALAQMETSTIVYQPVGHEWRPFGHPRRKRPLDSVVLDHGLADKIVNDVTEFIGSSDWYLSRGIPYRRGYLLHGPPGCGKSSFIGALAGHLNHSICMLSLSERTLTDDRLNHLLNMAPLRSLILLEDVDAAFVAKSREHDVDTQTQIAYQGLPHVTLSGLLNAIDGVSSSEARLLFMTTNYPERLDPALTRPGRVDYQQYIGACTDAQLSVMFHRFYADFGNEIDAKTVQSFVDRIRLASQDRAITPAQVQGYLLAYKHDWRNALDNVAHTFSDKKSSS